MQGHIGHKKHTQFMSLCTDSLYCGEILFYIACWIRHTLVMQFHMHTFGRKLYFKCPAKVQIPSGISRVELKIALKNPTLRYAQANARFELTASSCISGLAPFMLRYVGVLSGRQGYIDRETHSHQQVMPITRRLMMNTFCDLV